jgi:hypothetical protein
LNENGQMRMLAAEDGVIKVRIIKALQILAMA